MISPGDLVSPTDKNIIAFQEALWMAGEWRGLARRNMPYVEGTGVCVAVVRASGGDGWSHAAYIVWPNCVGWSYLQFIRKET